jgi:hypothetical protein
MSRKGLIFDTKNIDSPKQNTKMIGLLVPSVSVEGVDKNNPGPESGARKQQLEESAKLHAAIEALAKKLDVQQQHWTTRLSLAEHEYSALADLRIKEQERHFAQIKRSSVQRTKNFEAYKDAVLMQLKEASDARAADIQAAVDAARASHEAALDALSESAEQLTKARQSSVAESSLVSPSRAPSRPDSPLAASSPLTQATGPNADSVSSSSSGSSHGTNEALESLSLYAQRVENMIAALSQSHAHSRVVSPSTYLLPTASVNFSNSQVSRNTASMRVWGTQPQSSGNLPVANVPQLPPPPPHLVGGQATKINFQAGPVNRLHPSAIYPPHVLPNQARDGRVGQTAERMGPLEEQQRTSGYFLAASEAHFPQQQWQSSVPTVQSIMNMPPPPPPSFGGSLSWQKLEAAALQAPPPPPDDKPEHELPSAITARKHGQEADTDILEQYADSKVKVTTERPPSSVVLGRSSRLELPTTASLARTADANLQIANRLELEEKRVAVVNGRGLDNVFFRKKHLHPPTEAASRVLFAKQLYGDLHRHAVARDLQSRALKKSPTSVRVVATGEHSTRSSSPLRDIAQNAHERVDASF